MQQPPQQFFGQAPPGFPPQPGMPLQPGMAAPPMMQRPGMVAPMGMMVRPPITQKLDFPLDIQVHFKTKNIGHIKSNYKNKCRKYDSVFQHMPNIMEKLDNTPDDWKLGLKKAERIKQAKKEKIAANKIVNEEKKKEWNPFESEKHTGDPYKTLFVSNLHFDTSEKRIKREFDQHGEIKKIRIIKDNNNKSRGYAFVEYEHKKDMIQAYKNSEYVRLDGRRLIVDVERGRTVLDFTPRKYGGGIGNTRRDYDLSRSRSKDRKKKSKKDKKDKKRRKSRSQSYSRSRSRSERREKKSKRHDSPSEVEKKSKKEKRNRSYSPHEKKSKKEKHNKEKRQYPEEQQQQPQQNSNTENFGMNNERAQMIEMSDKQLKASHIEQEEEEGEIDEEQIERSNGDRKKKRKKSKDRSDHRDRDRDRDRESKKDKKKKKTNH